MSDTKCYAEMHLLLTWETESDADLIEQLGETLRGLNAVGFTFDMDGAQFLVNGVTRTWAEIKGGEHATPSPR